MTPTTEIEPIEVGEGLFRIYQGLPEVTLIEEENRLRTQLADISGKVIAISQIRENR